MTLDFDNPPADPVGQFQAWLEEAGGTGLHNPNAVALATADPEGRPSLRTVLLKGLDDRGAIFYTNRESRKGLQLAACPRAALLVYWDALGRQVSVEGAVDRIDDVGSDAYFASRPRISQLGAWASRQSEVVENRAALDARMAQVEREYDGRDVPRPPHWGGYRISLDRVEFWQNRDARLHDRIIYEPTANGWRVQRLCP